MAKLAAGLVIRRGSVELLGMEGKRVVASVREPMEAADPAHITKAIQRALESSALKTRKLAVSIQSQDILFRFFTIPLMPKAESDAAVQFEARRYIPFKTETLAWDYHATPSGKTKRQEVIFAGMPKEAFKAVTEAIGAAGVQATVIEPRSASLARLVGPMKGGAADEFVCLVDVEEDAAHIAIVKNRLPYLTRDIALVSSAGPAAVAGAAEPSGVAAEPVPAVQPEAGEEQSVQLDDPRAQRLLSELSVSIDFFMREYPSTKVSRVLLCGEARLIQPWGQWLSTKLSCPVVLGHELLTPRVEGGLDLSYASAVGVLQAANNAQGVLLNFLKVGAAPGARKRSLAPEFSIRDVVKLVKTPVCIASAVVAIGMLAALWVAGNMKVAAAQRQLEQVVSNRPKVGWGLAQMPPDAVEAMQEQVSNQLAVVRQILAQRVNLAAKLDALARTVPDGLWLTSLSFDDSLDVTTGRGEPTLVVRGACLLGTAEQEFRAIQSLGDSLKANPLFFKGFQSAQLDQISAEVSGSSEQTVRTFQLNCQSAEQRL